MCLAIPGQIKKINRNTAEVAWNKIKKQVGINLIKNLKVNDWVLVQNNLIVNKLTNTQAKKIIQLYE